MRRRDRLFASFALLLVLAPSACDSGSPDGDQGSPDRSVAGGGPTVTSASDPHPYLDRLSSSELPDRFVEATGLFLGTPYENGPLGEGAGHDPDPRVDFARADCVTYLEQALALAVVGSDDEFLGTLDAIRYRDAEVDFAARNHYMVMDWIPANAWLLEDVTVDVAPGLTRRVKRTIDRAGFLETQGVVPREGVDVSREIEIDIVPSVALAKIDSGIAPGDLIFWVGKSDGIFVVHTGLAVRSERGDLLFRHASSKAGEALDESFAEYAARASFAEGFLVLRLRDEPVAIRSAASG